MAARQILTLETYRSNRTRGTNLNICKNCNKKTRNIKFCSSSCANTHTNKHRKHSLQTKRKISETVKKNHSFRRYHKIKLWECTYCKKVRYVPIWYFKKTCSKECFSKHQAINAAKQYNTGYGKCGHYYNIKCQSRFELCFVIWCIDQNIPIKRANQKFEYFFENKKHLYTPDFIVDNKLIEIKGRITLRDKAKFAVAKEIEVIYPKDAIKYIDYVLDKYCLKYNELESLYENFIPKTTEQLNCKFCNKFFSRKSKISMFCSQSCAGKYRSLIRKSNKHLL